MCNSSMTGNIFICTMKILNPIGKIPNWYLTLPNFTYFFF